MLTSNSYTRRSFLKASALGLCAGSGLLTRVGWATTGTNKKMVVLFLRGGMDGLHLIPPIGHQVAEADQDLYNLHRPRISADPLGGSVENPMPNIGYSPHKFLTPEDDYSTTGFDLDGYFHCCPELQPLKDIFHQPNSKLAILHGVGGSGDRSHFTSQDLWERAQVRGTRLVGTNSGWLHDLLSHGVGSPSPLAAIALDSKLPKSYGGTLNRSKMLAFQNIEEFTLQGADYDQRISMFQQMYGDAWNLPAITNTGALALDALNTVAGVPPLLGAEDASVTYSYASPEFGEGALRKWLAQRLRDAARLISSVPEVSIITLDLNLGWDTHTKQHVRLKAASRELAIALAGFYQDLALSGTLEDTVVLAGSEFGRTFDQNGNGGTDHGEANALFVFGGQINRNPVGSTGVSITNRVERHPDWDDPSKGLSSMLFTLNNRYYVRHTIDYRAVYRDILQNHFGLSQSSIADIFGLTELGSEFFTTDLFA